MTPPVGPSEEKRELPPSPAVQAIDTTDKLVLGDVGDETSFEELMRERNRVRCSAG